MAAGFGMTAQRAIGLRRQFLQHLLDVVGGAAQMNFVDVDGDDAAGVFGRPDGQKVGEIEELPAELQIVGEENQAARMGTVVAVVHAQHQRNLFVLAKPIGAARARFRPDKACNSET